MTKVRGCVWAAANVIQSPPSPELIDAVEETYQQHKYDLPHPKGGVDWELLAVVHQERDVIQPTLF